MAYGGGAAAAAAAAAAIANATKASGAIIRMDPQQFQVILSRASKPVVVVSHEGVFQKNYRYLTVYKGLFFYTESRTPLMLAGDAEVIAAKQIWIPG